MAALLTTPPALEPVTLAQAKLHLRVDTSDDDTLVTSLIGAARMQVERHTGLVLITQQWSCFYDRWGDDGELAICIAPLLSVDALKVYAADDVAAVIDTAHYMADLVSRPGRLIIRGARSWSAPGRVANGIEVAVTAGYGALASDVPEPLCQAILQLIAHWYENRSPVHHGEVPRHVPLGVLALMAPFRQVRL